MVRPAGLGCGGLILVGLLALLFGEDPIRLLQLVSSVEQSQVAEHRGPQAPTGAPGDELGQFASIVLADTEETWHALLASMGESYREPRLVLFSDSVRSACGLNSAAVGPFYCPADGKVYLDLSFFRELERRFGAPGDFAQAYVIAHEVGHHVQSLLGISDEVHRMRSRLSEAEGNAWAVRLELQADCLAGVWGHHAHRQRALLEPGDLEEGLAAAAAIGDDRIQRQTQGYVVPESWTHGSSEQRVQWFARGFESGDPEDCDTFN